MPSQFLITEIDSAGPPNSCAALIFCRPCPGISTTVSRGIDRRAACPPPVRISMIVSERPGPVVSAPGSFEFFWRRSEPSTRMLLADVSGKPAGSSTRRDVRRRRRALEVRADQEQHERQRQPAERPARAGPSSTVCGLAQPAMRLAQPPAPRRCRRRAAGSAGAAGDTGVLGRLLGGAASSVRSCAARASSRRRER